MKIAIIFPFMRTMTSSFDGLPLSTPLLVGGIKNIIGELADITQIDLSREMVKYTNDNEFTGTEYIAVIKEIWKIIRDNKMRDDNAPLYQMVDNRLKSTVYLPSEQDLDRFRPFLKKLVKVARLNEFDHYFLTVYKTIESDVISALLLARYLKAEFPQKRIIFGGLHNYTGCIRDNLENLPFIDALVIGHGELSCADIIKRLNKNQPLKKIYDISVKSEQLLGCPDFSDFRNLDLFRFSQQRLMDRFNIHTAPNDKSVLLIPYKFTDGCFWGKCRYCASSRSGAGFSVKDIDTIVAELKSLKKTCRTDNFIFYNNNFNSGLAFTKKLLRAFIKNELNIRWTDSFNLAVFDDEILELLPRAGCIRMDIGTAVLEPKLQKFYNNILRDNRRLMWL